MQTTKTLNHGDAEMSLEYLLLFGLGIAAATVLALTGTEIAEFVIEQVKALLQ